MKKADSLVLDLRKWWRLVQAKNIGILGCDNLIRSIYEKEICRPFVSLF